MKGIVTVSAPGEASPNKIVCIVSGVYRQLSGKLQIHIYEMYITMRIKEK